MITKSGVLEFHAPNTIACGSINSGRRMLAPDVQERSCSHRLRVTLHVENKCMIDSLCDLHRERNGLAAILNLNNFSSKYELLFSIFSFFSFLSFKLLQLCDKNQALGIMNTSFS